jgi:hypothetical protein
MAHDGAFGEQAGEDRPAGEAKAPSLFIFSSADAFRVRPVAAACVAWDSGLCAERYES